MNDNDDNQNQNQDQTQVSKLPKPANIEHYFSKIQSNPKPWQIQAKIKPNPFDKNARISFKTQQNKFWGWDWKNNARVKFQGKDGKTKLTINLKMLENGSFGRSDRKFKNQGNKQSSYQFQHENKQKQGPDLTKQQQIQSLNNKNDDNNKEDKKQGKQNNNTGNLDLNLSTSYDNSKFNLKLKDNGQINIKFNQSADVIPNTLKAQFQYLYQYKNKANDVHKYGFQLLYTTGVRKWVYESLQKQIEKKEKEQENKIIVDLVYNKSRISLAQIYKLFNFNGNIFHKNETKIKCKIGSHCDTQIKLNSVNHFGNIKESNDIITEVNQKQQVQVSQSTNNGADMIENQQKSSLQSLSENQSTAPTIALTPSTPQLLTIQSNQSPLIKLELQNKLTLKHLSQTNSHAHDHDYNFKTTVSCQYLPIKQNIRLQTIINRSGLHNVQSRYLCKYWTMYAFGVMLGFNWNNHVKSWHRKWEIVAERQNLGKIGNLLLSVSDRCAGVRLVKKLGKVYKIELMASRRWNAKENDWGNFGIKINANW